MYLPILEFKGYWASIEGKIFRLENDELVELKPHTLNNEPNLYVFLRKADGSYAQRAVDKLMLEIFQPTEYEYSVVRHVNGNISDCSLSNLMWAKYRKCRNCTEYNICCTEFKKCKFGKKVGEKKPLTVAEKKQLERMRKIAEKAKAIELDDVKENLKCIVCALEMATFPREVYSFLKMQGYNFSIQYLYKIMRLVETDSPKLYRKNN